jgi:uncharacterized SAM-dependent methyltransferase
MNCESQITTAKLDEIKKEQIRVINCLDGCFEDSLAEDVKKGLSGAQKSLPSKYFYDERGSNLFK